MFFRLASHYREAFSMMGEANCDTTDITCGSGVKYVLFQPEIELNDATDPYCRTHAYATRVGIHLAARQQFQRAIKRIEHVSEPPRPTSTAGPQGAPFSPSLV